MTVDDAGLWCEIGSKIPVGQAALFLDRDGVVIVDTHYPGRAEDMRMIDGAASAIARCNSLKIPVVVVTNQSGIARGYYNWDAFRAVQAALSKALAAEGGHLDAVLACGYHGDGHGPLRIADHPWRKPNPGMILAAADRMKLDLSRSWIVGDKAHDLAAGLAAGLAGGVLVSTDERECNPAFALAGAQFIVETAANLMEAVARLIKTGQIAPRQPHD